MTCVHGSTASDRMPLNSVVHFWHTCVQVLHEQKGWDRGRWVGSPQGDMHMVAARLGCQYAVVGTGWANSCPGCMERFRKHDSHVVGGSFLAAKAAWALSRCLPTESADYCMLVSEWAWFKVMSLLVKAGSGLWFTFGVRA